MIPTFIFEPHFPRVRFGEGSVAGLAEEVDRLGAERVLLLCTPARRQVERLGALLGMRLVGVFDRARMHVPAAVVEQAREEVDRLDADCCVAVGGGSAIGLGKALALGGGPPLVAVPTTYSGSEATSIWGVSEGGQKRTGRDSRVLPRVVIYDPRLTLDLPPEIAGPSGLNALAHCMEALYAPDADPITLLLAEEGARALASSLAEVIRAPDSLEARSAALYGAWLAGTALGAAAMGMHHRLCHVLGGGFGLPHAETHAVILPHAAAFNRDAAPAAMQRMARALGAADVPAALFDLAVAVGAPTSLRGLGLREADLDRAAALATANPYPYTNPRPVDTEGVRVLLDDAFHGRRPASDILYT